MHHSGRYISQTLRHEFNLKQTHDTNFTWKACKDVVDALPSSGVQYQNKWVSRTDNFIGRHQITTQETFIMIMKKHREGIPMKSKSKQKLKKFTNLQRQERRVEVMKEEEYKYLKELLGKINHEDISTVTRGSLRPQHI